MFINKDVISNKGSIVYSCFFGNGFGFTFFKASLTYIYIFKAFLALTSFLNLTTTTYLIYFPVQPYIVAWPIRIPSISQIEYFIEYTVVSILD